MKENSLVSVIMPSYNTAKFIKESIQSVLNQTYINLELIIVDDKSTDNTIEVINSINDERILFLVNQNNRGTAFSRNRALEIAKGKWIAFLDSDDIWKKEKLENQIRFMEKYNYSFSYTNYLVINEYSNSNGVVWTGPKKVTKFGFNNYCYPGCLTVMYNQEKIGKIQIVEIPKNNDYAIWVKVVKKANCYLYDEVLASYRKREGSISNQRIIKLIKHHYILWRIAERRSVLLSVILTVRNLFFGLIKKLKYKRKL